MQPVIVIDSEQWQGYADRSPRGDHVTGLSYDSLPTRGRQREEGFRPQAAM